MGTETLSTDDELRWQLQADITHELVNIQWHDTLYNAHVMQSCSNRHVFKGLFKTSCSKQTMYL
jgi:hypothetical protein